MSSGMYNHSSLGTIVMVFSVISKPNTKTINHSMTLGNVMINLSDLIQDILYK